MSVSIPGAEPVKQSVDGTPVAGGSQLYVTSFAAPDGSWTVNVSLTVDWTSNPSTSIIGTVVTKNLSAEPIQFTIDFDVDICPSITEGAVNGGNGKLTLVTDGPGAMTCGDEPAVYGVKMNGELDSALFWCPFTLATTGSGSMSSTATFGLPGPSHPGPRNVSSIGTQLAFHLTPGDTATAWGILLFKDENGVTPALCPADLDGNGAVDGSDLGELFAQWGFESSCPSSLSGDLTGDGEVNADDLLELIVSWGICGDELKNDNR
ncbi:MAG: hypothetical protein JNM94_09365 [Phycisphaerae bacterium]|nr:hypothetical protein [Phycisphaerae bacterium]